MKRLLFVIFLLLFTAEKCERVPAGVDDSGRITYYEFDKNYTGHQVDSVCTVEGIPGDLELWISAKPLITPDKFIPQMAYILNDSTVFILTDLDSLYNFKKRVTRTVQEKL